MRARAGTRSSLVFLLRFSSCRTRRLFVLNSVVIYGFLLLVSPRQEAARMNEIARMPPMLHSFSPAHPAKTANRVIRR